MIGTTAICDSTSSPPVCVVCISVLTFLDHLSEVWLSEDFGHSEDHQCIFGINQICPHGSVQKHLEELCVHEQVLLNKQLPVKEQVNVRTNNDSSRYNIATSNIINGISPTEDLKLQHRHNNHNIHQHR